MVSKTAKKLGAEPAYPDSNGQANYTGGLTKREVIAAMAMEGMCTSHDFMRTLACVHEADTKTINAAIAEKSVGLADALLAELAKEADDGR